MWELPHRQKQIHLKQILNIQPTFIAIHPSYVSHLWWCVMSTLVWCIKSTSFYANWYPLHLGSYSLQIEYAFEKYMRTQNVLKWIYSQTYSASKSLERECNTSQSLFHWPPLIGRTSWHKEYKYILYTSHFRFCSLQYIQFVPPRRLVDINFSLREGVLSLPKFLFCHPFA